MTAAIDAAHLEQYVGDDAALRDEILAIFEDQAQEWLARLDPQADDQSWKNAAHALKGAARGVGAWAVGDLCEKAEGLVGRDCERAERPELVRSIVREMNAALAEVRRLRDRPGALNG